MYTILCRLLNDEAEAADALQDALQDAFLKVFRSLESYKGSGTLGAWIKTIVVRTGISKQKKRILFDDIDDEKLDLSESIIVWDENLTGEYLAMAIAQLPAGYRSVFVLVEVEGYKHQEVSEKLFNQVEGIHFFGLTSVFAYKTMF